MKTVEISLFQFDELDDKAKERARAWWRKCSEDDTFWSEYVIEEAVEQGKLLGITFKERERRSMTGKPLPPEPCIYWSGFSSQGSGAQFEGSWSARDVKADKVAADWGDSPETEEIKRVAAEFDQIAKAWPEASFTVKHSGHYHNEYSTDFDVTMLGEEAYNVTEKETADAAAAELDLTMVARDFMRWVYKQLNRAYDYENSDENIDENLRINEYDFLADGKRFEA